MASASYSRDHNAVRVHQASLSGDSRGRTPLRLFAGLTSLGWAVSSCVWMRLSHACVATVAVSASERWTETVVSSRRGARLVLVTARSAMPRLRCEDIPSSADLSVYALRCDV